MKRPLLLILIGLVLGELSGYLFYIAGAVIPASLILAFLPRWRSAGKEKPFFYRSTRKNVAAPCFNNNLLFMLCILSMILGQLSWCFEEAKINNVKTFLEKYEGMDCEVSAVVSACKESDSGYVTLTVANPVLSCGKSCLKIRGKGQMSGNLSNTSKVDPGDRIVLKATVCFPEKPRNPGGFNVRIYDLAGGIYVTGYISSLELKHHPLFSIRREAYSLKTRMEEGYRSSLNEEDSSMLCAMVFGDKSGLSEEQKKLYEENGVAHLLAISGLHVSSVGGRIYRILRKKGGSYLLSCLGGAILLLFYGCMTGFSTSVARALTMFLIFLLSESAGTSYDLVSSMSLAGILMLLEQPYRLLDGGFLISYGCVMAIGMAIPVARERIYPRSLPQAADFVLGELFSSLVIFCVTAPLIMRFYYECTPYSIILNPLVIPCMNPLMISALLSGIMTLFIGEMAGFPEICLWVRRLLCLPAILILRSYRMLFSCVRKLPGALIVTGCPPLWLICFIYGLEGIIAFLLYKRCWKKMIAVAVISLFLWMGPVTALTADREVHITMLDIGQGDCILVRMPGKKTMLIDGGSTSKDDIFENIIRPALYYYGIGQLDYVAVTHGDEDHISGISEMLQAGYPVKNILFGSNYYYSANTAVVIKKDEAISSVELDQAEQELCILAVKNDTEIHFMEKGDSLTLGDVTFSCLHPQIAEVYEDRNDKSMVFLMQFGDFRGLFMGDLSSEQEDKIVKSVSKPVNLLKVGHHGSKYSTGQTFLDKIRPEYAILSAGVGNRYGHPHSETLERLAAVHAKVYETLLRGAICVDTDGSKTQLFYWTDAGR